MWVRFFGVAYPAGAGGCEDWFLGGDRRGGFFVGRVRGEDFICTENKAGFAHGVCIKYPSEGVIVVSAGG